MAVEISKIIDRDRCLRDDVEADVMEKSLIRAVSERKYSTIVHMLSNGADIHADYDAALGKAAELGNVGMVLFLLNKGANIHAYDDYALRIASSVKLEDRRDKTNCSADDYFWVVKFLLDRGADIHCLNDWPLRWAIIVGNLERVRLLLDRGADIHVNDDEPLKLAAEYGRLNILLLLIKRGAKIVENRAECASLARRNRHRYVEGVFSSDLLYEFVAARKK